MQTISIPDIYVRFYTPALDLLWDGSTTNRGVRHCFNKGKQRFNDPLQVQSLIVQKINSLYNGHEPIILVRQWVFYSSISHVGTKHISAICLCCKSREKAGERISFLFVP